ncbi:MAG: Rieske (2Fe-2S) domain protein [Chloroflexi bacterium]|nr:Rieske (2Fe-2S) domain protein [Chloroflexota bacterium]
MTTPGLDPFGSEHSTAGADLLVADLNDPIILGRLAALAAKRGVSLVRIADLGEPSDAQPPIAIVVDIGSPGAIDRIGTWCRRWPSTLVAGSISFPDQERWHGALAAGASLVASRGAFVAQLERALEARSGGRGRDAAITRLPVRLMLREGDGLVGRLPDAPGGSIVVMRVAGRLHAIRDECPHAGASLADGTLDGPIITCPRHGSQFDVTTGARERGPSDFPIRTYRVASGEDGVFVEVPT